MAVIADRLARDYPDANRDHGVRVYTLAQGMMDEGTGPMLVAVAGVGVRSCCSSRAPTSPT